MIETGKSDGTGENGECDMIFHFSSFRVYSDKLAYAFKKNFTYVFMIEVR